MQRAFLLVLFVLLLSEIRAQDPQFSQFYSAPLYLNPAFAGSTQQARVGANYRTQWPAIDANFVSLSAYADYFIDDKNSGIGILITTDREGFAGLRSSTFSALYAYQLPLTEIFTFRAGFQAGYTLRGIDFNKLTFGDQFDQNGPTGLPSAEVFDASGARNYLDLSAGGLLYSRNAWIGLAVHHLTRPNQTLIGEESILARKWGVHVGYKFFLQPGVMGEGLYARPQERSLAPTIQYRKQGSFSQADIGLYLTYEPMLFGVWYRGIPFQGINGFVNHEALVFLLGFNQRGQDDEFHIGYSFDLTISQLGASSGGAHEFSIAYSWFAANPRKPPKNVRLIPCPR